MTKNVSINADDSLSREALYGPNVSFAVSEAYKLLRTNVMYSFASENRCHIVGVVSSVRGEGKSTTACNLAYALTEIGKRTLLIDCDLRLSSIAEMLGLSAALRDAGLRVDLPLSPAKMGNQLKRAEKIGARYAVIIGSEYPDLELKNIQTRESMHTSPNGLMTELLGDGEEV